MYPWKAQIKSWQISLLTFYHKPNINRTYILCLTFPIVPDIIKICSFSVCSLFDTKYHGNNTSSINCAKQAGFHPIIISWNSSKSMVPLPSSSTSSMMWSRSSSVRVLSISRRISFSTSFVMKPWPWKEWFNFFFLLFLTFHLFVVNPESLLEFLLHLLLIVLNHEFGGDLKTQDI